MRRTGRRFCFLQSGIAASSGKIEVEGSTVMRPTNLLLEDDDAVQPILKPTSKCHNLSPDEQIIVFDTGLGQSMEHSKIQHLMLVIDRQISRTFDLGRREALRSTVQCTASAIRSR